MRAKMSLPNHGTSDCAMRPGCCGHPSDAFDEARAILAETEPRALGMAGHRPTRGDMGAAGCALRDCLRAFVEDDTRPFVVEATAPRCMTGRPLRVQRRTA